MEVDELVKVKKLKGKQNKKKWIKNIDVSNLLEQAEKKHNMQLRIQNTKPLQLQDTTAQVRPQLHPDRFKNRPRSIPKQRYDNSYHRQDLIENNLDDLWNAPIQNSRQKKESLVVPAIIKPESGHSYNPRKEDLQKIIDDVIENEKVVPKKKKIKKLKELKRIVPRSRNKKVRQQYLEAQKRRYERLCKNQLNSVKSINREIEDKNKAIDKKIKEKQSKRDKIKRAAEEGKVREGPKLGKKRYQYREYIPKQEELGKKVSKIASSDETMKDRFDSVFRRGIFEVRNIKAMRMRRKNIKVKERFRDQ